ncbi:regulatory protein GemA [Sinirhodobacter populi]|uniref:Regulatory protein GemA n=2 Tax=Paenirhodobacter populi TaxID=2306993 RepID=A0A443KEY4_9RHOB|nr:regulatory protein GemA [Sinirhodobacter populi]
MTTARNLQRMIHVGCKQLGLDNDTRRDLQLVATGKASMADMSEADLQKVIEALKKRGFKTGFKASAKGSRAPAPRADLRYLHVLWRLLAEAGAIREPSRTGLNTFIRARFEGHWSFVPIDVDALRAPAQISDVTRALKDMCRRAGIPT